MCGESAGFVLTVAFWYVEFVSLYDCFCEFFVGFVYVCGRWEGVYLLFYVVCEVLPPRFSVVGEGGFLVWCVVVFVCGDCDKYG